MKWIAFAGMLLCMAVLNGTDAAAAGCGEITPGGRKGPFVPAGQYNKAFELPFKDVCFVQWKGGTRGAAGRAEDEHKCRNMPGAEFVEFYPDRGSNFNLCVFRPKASSGGGMAESAGADPDSGTDGGGTDLDDFGDDVWSSSPSEGSFTSETPDTANLAPVDHGMYTFELCNQTSESAWAAVALFENVDDANETVQGWWEILPGACESWSRRLGPWLTHEIYYHAQNNDGRWGKDIGLCVPPTKFRRLRSPGYQCSGSEELEQFTRVTVEQGRNRVNLVD